MKKVNHIAKRTLSLALAVLLALTLFGCGKAKKADADYVVKVAYGTALCHAPLHVAIQKGFFEAEGLKVEPTPLDTAATIDGAGTNTVDAGFGLIGKFAQPLENGLGIKLTAGIHGGCIKLVTGADSEIGDVAALKGKIIGVASLTDSPAIIVRRALANAGLKAAGDDLDVEFVVFANADLPAALLNGAIDAYAAMDPAVSVAVRDNGFKVLVDTAASAPFSNEFCCATFVTDKFATDHPDLAKKYTDAVVKAAQWIAQNPQEAAALQIEKEYVSGDAEFNGSLLATYGFHASTDGGYDSLKTTLEEMKKIGVLKADTDTAALLTRGYLKFK
jgi:NitT/TauT family transport system substrate-binding protein